MHCLTPPVPLMSALRRAVLSIDEAKALHRSVLGRGIGPGAGCTVVARTWIRSSGGGEETDVDESAEDGLLDGPSDSFARPRRAGAGGNRRHDRLPGVRGRDERGGLLVQRSDRTCGSACAASRAGRSPDAPPPGGQARDPVQGAQAARVREPRPFAQRICDGAQGAGGLIGGLLLIILAPIAAALIQLAVSRSREYEADHTGAEVSGDPMALASALRKLERATQVIPSQTAQPAFAHLYIVNPLSGQTLSTLFSTHPPLEERIRRLEAMAAGIRR